MSTIHACYQPEKPISSSIIERMLDASNYWTPDSTSQLSSQLNICHLAKASLYNTEISESDHVYQDPDTKAIISANARLDNREELANALGISEESLSQTSDGQLILKAYLHWRDECPKHLLGDFVFIIWDEINQRLFCARDHFGVKVLFYSHNESGIMLSNEHKAFFTSSWQKKQIKERWLVRYLWDLGARSTQSPYKGIEILPPSHSLVFDSSGLSISRYWSLEANNKWLGMDDETLIDELKSRFQQAVAVRLNSTYPLGTELSEGLDSNGIAGYAAQMLGDDPIYSFSYRCQKLSDNNHEVWAGTYQDIFAMLNMHDNLIPVWSNSDIAQHSDDDIDNLYHHSGQMLDFRGGHLLRARLAHQQGIRTMLSGWGGDHCVSSYGDFYESELFSQGKLLATHKLLQQKFRRGRGMKPIKGWVWLLLKHLAPALFYQLLNRRQGLQKGLHQKAKQSILKPTIIKDHRLKGKLRQFCRSYHRFSVQAHHQRELFDIGVENRLIESEMSGRLFRMEYRYPMLDLRLVEFAYNMPSHLKVYQGVERYMFRRVLEGITTHRIQWRRKEDVIHPSHARESVAQFSDDNPHREIENSDIFRDYCDTNQWKEMTRADNHHRQRSELQKLLRVIKHLKNIEVVAT